MANLDEISSRLSTLFLNDFELPDLQEVEKLVSDKHSEKLCYDNGIDSLNEIICTFLLQKSLFFSLCNCVHKPVSKDFVKKFSYQGELLDKNMIIAAIELVLMQDEMLSAEEVQSIVDHQKCVVLFNQISFEKLSETYDFLLELFAIEDPYVNDYLVPSERQKLIYNKIRKMKKGLDEVDQNVVMLGDACSCDCEHDCTCDFYL